MTWQEEISKRLEGLEVITITIMERLDTLVALNTKVIDLEASNQQVNTKEEVWVSIDVVRAKMITRASIESVEELR